jgi:enoyl-CoA hydratase/carnithine racemase
MNPTEFTTTRYEVRDGVATVTFANPEGHNTWSASTALEYRWALHVANDDSDVRVIVVTGSGSAFCVGADAGALRQIADTGGAYKRSSASRPPYPEATPAAFRHNHAAPLLVDKPVIAALNGACAGAGFVVATYADLRWASDQAKIASSFAGLGLPAEYGLGWILPRLIGTTRSLEWLYDPSPRTAEEALQSGYVQRVVRHDELLDAVSEYAQRLARHSSADSLRMIKRAVLFDSLGDFGTAYRNSVAEMDGALAGEDFHLALRGRRAETRADFLARTPL